MKTSFLFAALLALGYGLSPHAVLAQATDQTTTAPMGTTAPMATDTPVPGTTMNPMASPTTAPVENTYTTTSGGNSGWWGLIGLIGLLGLFGTRGRSTTISGPP
jgi:hypothetical protein